MSSATGGVGFQVVHMELDCLPDLWVSQQEEGEKNQEYPLFWLLLHTTYSLYPSAYLSIYPSAALPPSKY